MMSGETSPKIAPGLVVVLLRLLRRSARSVELTRPSLLRTPDRFAPTLLKFIFNSDSSAELTFPSLFKSPRRCLAAALSILGLDEAYWAAKGELATIFDG